jgi:hypothetical protein
MLRISAQSMNAHSVLGVVLFHDRHVSGWTCVLQPECSPAGIFNEPY